MESSLNNIAASSKFLPENFVKFFRTNTLQNIGDSENIYFFRVNDDRNRKKRKLLATASEFILK